MDTLYLKVNGTRPESDLIKKAADLLLAGELVAFPTETVYGLGAIISHDNAVREIFRIKNRPFSNPLLVHISNLEQVQGIALDISAIAIKLIDKFWPGPLSLILPSHPDISTLITANTGKVGLRMPSHPVALELIEKSGPLAGTSANISNRPSPTKAQHVWDDLRGKIAAIIDAGETGIGIESTIIDLSETSPQILRLGGISLGEIEDAVGVRFTKVKNPQGNYYKSKVKIILSENSDIYERNIMDHGQNNEKIGIVHNNYFPKHIVKKVDKEYELNVSLASGRLFDLLRDAENSNLDVLIFAPLPQDAKKVNQALLDRIHKAKDWKE